MTFIYQSKLYCALDYIFAELGWTDGRNMPKEIFGDEMPSI